MRVASSVIRRRGGKGYARHLVATFGWHKAAPLPESERIVSVAFRRESDDEHMEPVFEWPIPPGANLVTPRGLRLLGEELAALEAAIAAEADVEARKKLQRRQRYVATRHATAEVQAAPENGVVGVGSAVRYALNGAERAATIVGHDEADPAAGLIAFTAPLGRALMRAEAGDMVAFQGREDAIEILAAVADAKVQA
ncbi:Transcription elongation factor, GreA/GreB family [Sphingopyxis indica]|uniref:Transcription elongation factor, GreA/GreB family n=1 Tax=Sphingopyxis indica TaxID=436663 RepID=A0A239J2Z5_9SPHN|nr:Transcription elongation factor, GreA/GreB family [Sphingopyxis indica]